MYLFFCFIDLYLSKLIHILTNLRIVFLFLNVLCRPVDFHHNFLSDVNTNVMLKNTNMSIFLSLKSKNSAASRHWLMMIQFCFSYKKNVNYFDWNNHPKYQLIINSQDSSTQLNLRVTYFRFLSSPFSGHY